MNCLPAIEKEFLQILFYSGRGIQKIGQYANCVQHPDMDYKMLRFYPNQSPALVLFEGLCLPKQCTGSELNTTLQFLIKQFKVPITIVSIEEHIPEVTAKYSGSFILTVLLLFVLTALVLVSSLSKSVGSHPSLSAFSLKNSLKIFKHRENSLNVLNGVRSLSMLWVIFGHQYGLILGQISNSSSLSEIISQWFMLLITGGLFAVDTFFFVGGFLMAYVFLREETQTLMKYPLAILNRYLRFVPSYFIAIMIFRQFLPHMGTGPFWSQNMLGVDFCNKLWKPLLFVDNLIDNGDTICMGWAWYLQNDMQIFVYCTLIMLIYSRYRKSSFVLILATIVFSFVYNMIYTYQNKIHNMFKLEDTLTWGQYFGDIYIKPWARCPPYLYGLLIGILYSQFLIASKKQENPRSLLCAFKSKFSQSPLQRRIFELAGVAFGTFILLIPRTAQGDGEWSQMAHSIYLTFAKCFFVVALSMIILPSLLGIKSIVIWMMDTRFFNWISKISFWTYLIHLTIMTQWFGSINSDQYYALVPIYGLFVSHSVMSMSFGLIFTLIIEVPFTKLQKKLMHLLMNKRVRMHEQKISVDQSIKREESNSHIVNQSLVGQQKVEEE